MIFRLVNTDPANFVNELWTRWNIPSLANTKLETDNLTFAQCRTYCKGGQEQQVCNNLEGPRLYLERKGKIK